MAKRVAADIMALINRLFPGASWTRRDLNALVTEAYRVTDDDYGEQEAIVWADKFKFPSDIGDRDGALLKEANYDLGEVVQVKHDLMSLGGRPSAERIQAVVPVDDPDYHRFLGLVQGIEIVTAETFVPNEDPPPLR